MNKNIIPKVEILSNFGCCSDTDMKFGYQVDLLGAAHGDFGHFRYRHLGCLPRFVSGGRMFDVDQLTCFKTAEICSNDSLVFSMSNPTQLEKFGFLCGPFLQWIGHVS